MWVKWKKTLEGIHPKFGRVHSGSLKYLDPHRADEAVRAGLAEMVSDSDERPKKAAKSKKEVSDANS